MPSRQLEQCLAALQTIPSRLPNIEGDLPVTATIAEAIPEGTSIECASQCGDCNIWFVTGRLDARNRSAEEVSYFVKYGVGDLGKALLESEYYAMKKLEILLPGAVPEPLACGCLDSSFRCGYFYIARFLDFQHETLPPLEQTGNIVARLHQASIGRSPFFGSPVPMYDGIFCHVDSLETRWQTLFVKMLQRAWWNDMTTNGRSIEVDTALAAVIHHVVPRLLNELEKDGNIVEPCFIHGDLWEGNIATVVPSGEVFIFDSNGYYAHFEMEFALWRTKHHQMHLKDYCAEYFKHRQPSKPVEEFEDRLKLYGLKALLMYSATTLKHITRLRALQDMKDLLLKYPPPEAGSSHSNVLSAEEDTITPSVKHTAEVAQLIEDLSSA